MKISHLICPRCNNEMWTEDGINFICHNPRHEKIETTLHEQMYILFTHFMERYAKEKESVEDNQNKEV